MTAANARTAVREITMDSPVGALWHDAPAGPAALVAHSALRRGGIRTVARLTKCTPEEILRLNGAGPKSLDAIRTGLSVHGLALAGEKPGDDVSGASDVTLDVEALGISLRQLRYWVQQGYLRPQRPQRSLQWTAAEATVVRRMARLVNAGLIPAKAAVFARELWPAGEIAPGIRIEVTRR